MTHQKHLLQGMRILEKKKPIYWSMTEQSPKQFMGLLKNDFLHIQTPKEERLVRTR